MNGPVFPSAKPSFPSDSLDAINVAIEVVGDTTIRPIDPQDKDLPRLLELKRLLEEQKKQNRNEGS